MSAALDEESARALVEDFADAIISYESEVSGGTDHGRREAQNEISKTRAALIRALTGSAPSPSAGGALHGSGENSPSSLDEETIEAVLKAIEPFARLAKEQFSDGGPMLGEYLKLRREKITWNGEHDITPADLRTLLKVYEQAKSTPSLQGGGELVPIYCKPWRTIVFVPQKNKAELLALNAPAVSGEGWMAHCAKEISLIERDTWRDSDDLARLIYQIIDHHAAFAEGHFPSPEGRGSGTLTALADEPTTSTPAPHKVRE